MVKAEVVTVSIMDQDEINSEYEFSNENFDKLVDFLKKEKGFKNYAWEGNMFSLEYTSKPSVLKFKRLMEKLSKDKDKDDKVGVEWGYWQSD